MVGTARFELATPCTPSKCATGLRYVPKTKAIYESELWDSTACQIMAEITFMLRARMIVLNMNAKIP